MKKLVILSPSDIEYVMEIAKKVSPSGTNFSKGLRKIIEDHKWKELKDLKK